MLSGDPKPVGDNDRCIGNRKARSIFFSIILIVFMSFGLSLFFDLQDSWSDDDVQEACSQCDKPSYAFYLVIMGAFTIIASAGMCVLLFFVNCGDKLGRVAVEYTDCILLHICIIC